MVRKQIEVGDTKIKYTILKPVRKHRFWRRDLRRQHNRFYRF